MSTAKPPLLPVQRRESVLAQLRARGALRVVDIARALDVSTVTVRRDLAQLADDGAIERVHGGIRLPHGTTWQPSELPARAEAPSGKANLCPVGMVVPSLNYFWPQIVRGARDAASAAGMRIVLRGSSYEDVDDFRRQTLWLLKTVRVQGLLIAPPTSCAAAAKLVGWLARLPIPVTFVELLGTLGPLHEHVESVSTDHDVGVGLALRHLAAEGHRRIGLLGCSTSPTTPPVRHGWRRIAEETGLEFVGIPNMITPNYRDPTWTARLEAFLDACIATRTRALLVHSDREAISLVGRCRERGIRVPEDLAVVAYDDEVAEFGEPALTAVRLAMPVIGQTAVELLAKRIQGGPERPAHRIQINPWLVIRDSSTC